MVDHAAKTIERFPSERIPVPRAADHYVFDRDHLWSPEHSLIELRDVTVQIDWRVPWSPFLRITRGDVELYSYGEAASDWQAQPTIELERVSLLEDRYVGFNISHLLFDKMARLLLLRENGVLAEHVLVRDGGAYTKHMLGDTTRIDILCGTINCESLTLCTNSLGAYAHPGNYYHSRFRDALATLAAPVPGKRHVYISRSADRFRRVLNEADL